MRIHRTRRMDGRAFTLFEIIVASVLGAFLAGGTMMAFVTAIKISQDASSGGEGSFFAQQTLERYRNTIACRRPAETPADTWYDATCNPSAPGAWTPDPPPLGSGIDTREYKAVPFDCDGVGGAGDCLKVTVKVCWDDPAC